MAPPAPTAKGVYSVCLPASLEIDKNDFSRIGDVHPNDQDNDTYIVEFKYWQDASRYLKAARTAQTQSSRKAGYDRQQAPAVPDQMMDSSLHSTPTASTTESTLPVVEVSELPKHLMSQRMLEATLEQAGLEKDVTNISFVAADKVNITFSNREAATVCARHFHGRKWNRGGNVCAKILTGSGSNRKKSEAVTASPSASKVLSKYAPAYVHSALLEGSVSTSWKQMGHITSDASTTVSDEDEESWERDIRNVISECSFD